MRNYALGWTFIRDCRYRAGFAMASVAIAPSVLVFRSLHFENCNNTKDARFGLETNEVALRIFRMETRTLVNKVLWPLTV